MWQNLTRNMQRNLRVIGVGALVCVVIVAFALLFRSRLPGGALSVDARALHGSQLGAAPTDTALDVPTATPGATPVATDTPPGAPAATDTPANTPVPTATPAPPAVSVSPQSVAASCSGGSVAVTITNTSSTDSAVWSAVSSPASLGYGFAPSGMNLLPGAHVQLSITNINSGGSVIVNSRGTLTTITVTCA